MQPYKSKVPNQPPLVLSISIFFYFSITRALTGIAGTRSAKHFSISILKGIMFPKEQFSENNPKRVPINFVRREQMNVIRMMPKYNFTLPES